MARRGWTLALAGLLVCGRCGYRMATCYRTNGRDLRYQCSRGNVSKGAGYCQSVAGRAIDTVVEQLLLDALQPSAIEVSLALAEEVEIDRTRRRRQRALRLEQAAYEVSRAERQYNAVEPENRLVARTLEKRWEAALAEHDRLIAEQKREDAPPPQLTPAERDAIRHLAEDVPTLWRAPTTTAAERKEIARLMLERVLLTIEGGANRPRSCAPGRAGARRPTASCVQSGGPISSPAARRCGRGSWTSRRRAIVLPRSRAA